MTGLLCALFLSATPPAPPSAHRLGPAIDQVRHGDRVFAALERGGIAVIDVSKPRSPRLIGMLADGVVFHRLVIDRDLLIAARARMDASVWRLGDSTLPVPATLSAV